MQDAAQGRWASPGGSFHRIGRGSVLLPEKKEITVVAEDIFGEHREMSSSATGLEGCLWTLILHFHDTVFICFDMTVAEFSDCQDIACS